MDVAGDPASSVIEWFIVTGVAVLRVGPGGPQRSVPRPLASPIEIRSRHASEPLALAYIRTPTIESIELCLEQLIAVLEGFLEGLFVLACHDEVIELFLIDMLSGWKVRRRTRDSSKMNA